MVAGGWGEEMRRASLMGCAVIFGMMAAGPATAGLGNAKFGAWDRRCETPPGARDEQCYVAQTVTAAERPNVTLIVFALLTADHKARILRVIAPLGTLLTAGVALTVGGQDFGVAQYVRCLPNGCVAEAALDDKLMAALKGQGEAQVKVFQTPEEGISVSVPLDGFKAAFESLP